MRTQTLNSVPTDVNPRQGLRALVHLHSLATMSNAKDRAVQALSLIRKLKELVHQEKDVYSHASLVHLEHHFIWRLEPIQNVKPNVLFSHNVAVLMVANTRRSHTFIPDGNMFHLITKATESGQTVRDEYMTTQQANAYARVLLKNTTAFISYKD